MLSVLVTEANLGFDVAPPLKERASSSQASELMTSDLVVCRGGSRLSLLSCLDVVYFPHPTILLELRGYLMYQDTIPHCIIAD